MTGLGRITVDECGTILGVDPLFCATIRAESDALIGGNILDFTAPADRERCIVVLTTVRCGAAPMVTVKRMIRHDGTHLWVHNSVTACAMPDGPQRISIVIRESAAPSDWVDPADLLDVAKFLFDSRRRRNRVFQEALFSDHAWDILLAAYISESEGRVLTVADLHAMIGITLMNASRWMRALSSDGLLEFEDGSQETMTTASLRLSCEAHRRFETYLIDMHRTRR